MPPVSLAGIVTLCVCTTLVANYVLAGEDHSQYDVPQYRLKSGRTAESEINKAVSQTILSANPLTPTERQCASINHPVVPPLGSLVTMQPIGYGSDPVPGESVYAGRNHVTLRRETGEDPAKMTVHFSRMQYILKSVR